MAMVPLPSADRTMICARHTCFCGLLRSRMIDCKRTRSAGVTVMEMPLRITNNRTKSNHQKLSFGLFRQVQSTSALHGVYLGGPVDFAGYFDALQGKSTGTLYVIWRCCSCVRSARLDGQKLTACLCFGTQLGPHPRSAQVVDLAPKIWLDGVPIGAARNPYPERIGTASSMAYDASYGS
jgi:hypothetical protein